MTIEMPVPPEAGDVTHPEHEIYFQNTGQCFAGPTCQVHQDEIRRGRPGGDEISDLSLEQ